jgi:hypothetical protein
MTRYGALYEETKHLPLKGVAALVRKRLKARWPTCRFSVRCGPGRSLIVEVVGGWNEDVIHPARLAREALLPHHDRTRASLYGRAARQLLAEAEALVAEYNFDGSEPQSDYFHVRFYAEVRFDYDVAAAAKVRTLALLAAGLEDAKVAVAAGDVAHALRFIDALEREDAAAATAPAAAPEAA